MKSAITFLYAILVATLLPGCGEPRQLSNTEKEFVGYWEYSDSKDSDNEDMHIVKNLKLKDDGEFSLELSVNLDVKSWNEVQTSGMFAFQRGVELEDVLEVSLNIDGKWTITGRYLCFDFESDQPNFKISKTYKGYLAYIATDVPKKAISRMEKVIEDYENTSPEALLEKFNLDIVVEIVSMENSSMTLKPENGRKETFHRKDKKGTPSYVYNPAEEISTEELHAEELYAEELEIDCEDSSISEQLQVESHNGLTEPLSPQAGNTYDAKNLTDGNNNTAWAVKLADSGYEDSDYLWGPNLSLNATRIDAVEIVNGYAKNNNSFKNNTRASWIMIYRPDSPDSGHPSEDDIIYSGELHDTMNPQMLRVNRKYDNSRPTKNLCIVFSNKQNNKFYHGAKWDDLVISEIKIYGSR